jgi:formate dehydrogenase major subunit
MTNDIAGIKEADVILIIGSDTSEAHPVIGSRIKQAVKFGNTKLIVIDPKEINMAKYATIYARHRSGTDVAVLNGIMNVIIENEWYDKNYVAERCEGFEELKSVVKDYTPEKVEKISGVPAQQIIDIAELFGKAKTAGLFYAMGITQHTTGVDNVMSTANIQMLCGNLGVNGGGVNPLRGQSNVQGACDMGSLPVVFTSYQAVANQEVVDKFSKAWNRELSSKPGLTMIKMLEGAGNGTLKALYVMGENPMLSDPDLTHVKKELENLDFLVVQDIFLTETAEIADVVLPAASFAEKDGLFTNTERRAQRLRKVIKSPGQAKEDWIIIQEIANAMGSDWNYESALDIAQEICELSPSYAGITWERVGDTGLQWPCPSLDHPGTPYLHKGQFTRGKGMMKGIPFKEPAELPDDNYPLILTTGRVLQQFHTGTMTRKSQGLNNLAGPMVMISVDDAEELGISNGETVMVTSRRGEIQSPAFVTKRIGKGTIYIPFHYKEAAANMLTNPVYDPVAGIPEYKACAAKVSKIAV